MKFFDDYLGQKNKKNHAICGDYCICERTPQGTIYIVCDGIGSGVYANISAINCASRILEMYQNGMSIRTASEMVAAGMHRARKEDIPFSAFSVAVILPDGEFTAYSYEAPSPIIMQDEQATVLSPRFYTAGFEIIAEVYGLLHFGDSLLLFSDGVSQAGLGHGYGNGIGSEGVSDFINRNYKPNESVKELPDRILEMCKSMSGDNFEDDTTLALIHCREAEELTLLTGPPSRQALDSVYVADFMEMPGRKIVTGSTTTDIVARELQKEVETLSLGKAFGQLPEYHIDGIDLVTEGAITLNQVNNIMDEPVEQLSGNSVVERYCCMLHEADVIHIMVGKAANTAHEDLIFKKIGVHLRKATLEQIIAKLKRKGKLVIERYY